MARQPLCINNQCHQIAQSSAIKVLLRHLVRRYTTKCINNYAYSTKREGFLFEKEFDLLKPLTDFSIRGANNLCVRIIVVCILRNLDRTIGRLLHPARGS